MNKDTVAQILQETEAGYDLMADKFSETRKFFWRDLEFIRDYAQDGDNILDFGCGNGRLLEILAGKNLDYTGVDVSQKLIELAKGKYPGEKTKFQKIAGSESLPFPDNYFNAVYAVAVFHHLPSAELREFWAKELWRVLRPGGRMVVTVWDLWQPKYLKNILKNWLNKLIGRSKLDWNDCYIIFKNNDGRIFKRYHHAFTRKELAHSLKVSSFYPERTAKLGRNLVVVARK